MIAMDDHNTSLPTLGQLIEQRLALLHSLAASLESSTPALIRNDAEAIARGAAHQAELCRQWSRMENVLRQNQHRRASGGNFAGASGVSSDTESAAHLVLLS